MSTITLHVYVHIIHTYSNASKSNVIILRFTVCMYLSSYYMNVKRTTSEQ